MADLKAKAQEEPKWVDVTIPSIEMEPFKFTVGGAPSVTADVLRKLAGDPFGDEPKYGTAYDFFGGGEEGHDACVALFSLTAIGSVGLQFVLWIIVWVFFLFSSAQCLLEQSSTTYPLTNT